MAIPQISVELAAVGAKLGIELIQQIVEAVKDADEWEPISVILPEKSRLEIKIALEREKTKEAISAALKGS